MNNVYQIITDRITAMLEAGVVPWKRGWRTGLPQNVHGHKYRGINVWMLLSQGYGSPFWLTYNQARKLGGNVKSGETGMPVVYWNFRDVVTAEKDAETGEAIVKRVPFLRYYTVFNLEQTKDIGLGYKPENTLSSEATVVSAQAIIENMVDKPVIHHMGGQAFYRPATDEIYLPPKTMFTGIEDYYSTTFHEVTHWTGHETRLNRPGITDLAGFGSHNYSQEELVAEMGAAFLCAEARISEGVIENQTAYIQGWLKKLKNDKKLVVVAAAQAQKAADYVLNMNTATVEEVDA